MLRRGRRPCRGGGALLTGEIQHVLGERDHLSMATVYLQAPRASVPPPPPPLLLSAGSTAGTACICTPPLLLSAGATAGFSKNLIRESWSPTG